MHEVVRMLLQAQTDHAIAFITFFNPSRGADPSFARCHWSHPDLILLLLSKAVLFLPTKTVVLS